MKKKFLIITTVPTSLFFFRGQVGELKSEFDVEVVTSEGPNFEIFCRDENVVGHKVPMKRDISILHDVKGLIKLIQLFKKIKPDVIHGNTPKGGFLSMIAGWITRVPIRVYCVHGLRYEGATGIKRRLLKSMERFSCKFSTHVFTVSFGVKEILKKEKITNKEVKVIWNGSVNGINTEYFDPNKIDTTRLVSELKLDETSFVYGFVGRLVKDKGINELVEAFQNINIRHPHTKLLLVGPFEKVNAVLDKTKEAIITNENIISLGWQTDIRPFLKIMDIFTFPSYREGFGISLMEAAAMNVPAISSNITGCNEIIQDGYNGKLIPSKSVIKLQEQMEEFALNAKLLSEMSSVSRGHVVKKYEQKKLWNKAVEAYKEIVNNAV